MHAVSEVNVSVSAFRIHHIVAGGLAAARVAGLVTFTVIGFCFQNDAGNALAVNQAYQALT